MMQKTGCRDSGTSAARANSAPPAAMDRLVKRGRLCSLMRLPTSSQLTVRSAPPRPAPRFTAQSTDVYKRQQEGSLPFSWRSAHKSQIFVNAGMKS